jgi:RNA polymerase sigma-70 factor, ECF subfamily
MPDGQSPAPDDEALVRLARGGSRAACEELFQRHRGVAYRVAFRLLGHDQDAQDAVQDGSIKAFLALADFDGRSAFRTWFVRIVHNAALDLGRKRGRRAAYGFGPSANGHSGDPDAKAREPATEDDPALGLHRQDLRRQVDAALGKLSPKLRATFVLFAEAGLSYKEIAETQAVPIGTVMSRIHEARQKLMASDDIRDADGTP